MPAAAPLPVVLITGAAKRLGREIALTLAQAGWRIAVHYRNSREEAIKTVADCIALGAACASFASDLHDEAAIQQLFEDVRTAFGQVDAVVNNASTFEHDSVASFGFSAMEKHLRSNTGAPILLAQALYAHVSVRNARGVVINLLDQKLWNQNPDFFSYTLSKAALEAANTMLAMAMAPQLRVVGIAPGLTMTSHMLSDVQFDTLHKLSPLKRSSTPADVAATVKFALENQSITGTTLLIDGGQHLMKFERDFSFMSPSQN